MEKIKTNNLDSILEFAEGEFSKEAILKYKKEVLTELQYGRIIISIVDGEVDNIKVVKNYKPLMVDKKDGFK